MRECEDQKEAGDKYAKKKNSFSPLKLYEAVF